MLRFIKFLTFINLSLVPLSAYACMHYEELELQRKKSSIIRKNFSNEGNCTIAQENFEYVEGELKTLSEHYWYDTDLKVYYARVLFKQDKLQEGLNVYAQALMYEEMPQERVSEYMFYLKEIGINGCFLKSLIDDLDCCIQNPPKYAALKKIGTKNLKDFNQKINLSFMKEVTEVLGLLKKLPTQHCYEATLSIFLATLEAYNLSSVASQLVGQLYNQGDGDFSPFLRERYAFLCMVNERKYDRALQLYESILGTELDADNPYQTGLNYNSLGFLYYAAGNYNKSIQAWENGCLLKYDPVLVKNLACAQIYAEHYEDALKNLQTLMNLPSGELKKHKITNFETIYRLALQKAGRTDELQAILQRCLEASFEKRKKRGLLIKNAIEQAGLIEKQAKHLGTEHGKKSVAKQTKITEFSSKEEPTFLDEHLTSIKSKRTREPQIEKKPKIKTRGVAQAQVAPITTIEQEVRPIVTIETLLKPSSNPYKIFCKFFERYEGKKDSQVKISMTALETLMAALGQDFDRSSGKGSHIKGRFNFQDEINEQMVILSNQIFLIPAQIKNIREDFLLYNFYPKHLKGKLESKGLI